MIEFDDNGLTIHSKLDKNEAIVFCKFLVAEKKRHMEDIKMIENTIDFLENKHGFDINNMIRS